MNRLLAHSNISIIKRVQCFLVALLIVATQAFAVIQAQPAAAVASTGDQYDVMRQKYVSDLIGTINGSDQVGDVTTPKVTLATDAQNYWSTLSTGTGEPWADINTAATSTDMMNAYRRISTMALAVKTPGNTLYNNPDLLRDTIRTADWMYANRYNATRAVDSQWWQTQIGIPIESNNITALLYDDLTSTQVANYMKAVNRFSPSVIKTGANRVWYAFVVGLRAVIVKNPTKIKEAADGIVPALTTVTKSDGYYDDGSFVQHTYFAYTGAYGVSMIDTLSKLYYLLDNSAWEITSPEGLSIYDRVETTYSPITWCGGVMSSVRGRDISRETAQDIGKGVILQASVLRLAEIAPTAAAQQKLKSIAKSWIMCNSVNNVNIESTGEVSDIIRARLSVNDTNVNPAPLGSGTRALVGMDRYTATSPTYGFAVSMSSKRISNYESINSENMSGWYTGDGASYLYLGHGGQYDNNYWATVNPYNIPGTTEDTISRSPSEGANTRSIASFVGSLATPSRQTGIAAMDFRAYNTSLQAKKAWFTFDNEIVALGSGITATGMTGIGQDGTARHAETTIDNRQALSNDTQLRINGTQVYDDTSRTDNANWASISGSGESVGYIFPSTTTITAKNQGRTSNWGLININGSSTNVTDRYFTLTTNHGTNPTNKTYAYTILPNANEAATAAYAQNQDVTILSNTAQLGAARDKSTGTVSAVDWTNSSAQTIKVDGATYATINGASLVSIQEYGNVVTVSVSDPTQLKTTPVTITLPRSLNEITTSTRSDTTVARNENSTVITTYPGAAKGQTVSISFLKTAPPKTFTVTNEATIAGTPTTGQQLSAVEPTFSPAPDAIKYQWLRNGIEIANAVNKVYTLTSDDAGARMSVAVTAIQEGYDDTKVISAETDAVSTPLSTFTTTPTPTISGAARVNTTLTALVGTWSPSPDSFTYQWYRNGVAVNGATNKTYKTTTADYGDRLSVRVTATKAGYTSVTLLSAQTSAIRYF